MKRKIKDYLKIGVFLFGISLLFFSCEQEEISDLLETVIKKPSVLRETVTFNSIKHFQ